MRGPVFALPRIQEDTLKNIPSILPDSWGNAFGAKTCCACIPTCAKKKKKESWRIIDVLVFCQGVNPGGNPEMRNEKRAHAGAGVTILRTLVTTP